jgi:hypothetical protein
MNVNKIVIGTVALFVFCFSAGIANAQEKTKTTHQKTRTLTGCLKQGDEANEFDFVAKDGGKWDVKSDNVKLAPHVGHTVTVTGVVSNATAHGVKEDVKEEAKEHGISKNATETGDLRITNLKMVSKTCK